MQRNFSTFTDVIVPVMMTFKTVTTNVQIGLINYNFATGLPWWATLATATILMKMLLFPLVRFQVLALQRMGLAAPEIAMLYQLLRDGMFQLKLHEIGAKIKLIRAFFRGAGAALTLHNASVSRLMMLPLLNGSLFITFVISLRQLLASDHKEKLQDGGILWFADLTAKDSYFILPLTALGLTYTTSAIAFRNVTGGPVSPLAVLIRDSFQCASILLIPSVVTFEAGIFCYWIPSTLFALCQLLALRHPATLRFLRIPVMKPPGGVTPGQLPIGGAPKP